MPQALVIALYSLMVLPSICTFLQVKTRQILQQNLLPLLMHILILLQLSIQVL
jgi:hypothetical protein